MMPLRHIRQRIAEAVCPELREQRDQLEREASFDAVTGIANRRALDRALPAAEADAHTLVVVFDVNNFKAVNDCLGHVAGDALLREVALSIWRAASRFGYGVRVFRYGGDEFVVLASAMTACLIRDEAEEEFGARLVEGVRVSLSGTVGMTLAEADAALGARKAVRKGSHAR